MNFPKKSVIIVVIFSFTALILCIGTNFLLKRNHCPSPDYVTDEAIHRFVELVFEAKNNGNEILLNISNETVSEQLQEFPNIPDVDFSVLPLDFLDTKYNFMVEFESGEYFRLWLEYEQWPDLCDYTDITDEEILSHFRILRIGSLHLSDDAVSMYMDYIFATLEDNEEELIANYLEAENLKTLSDLLPYYTGVTKVWGLDYEHASYRIRINKSDSVEILLVASPDAYFLPSNKISDEFLLENIFLERIKAYLP